MMRTQHPIRDAFRSLLILRDQAQRCLSAGCDKTIGESARENVSLVIGFPLYGALGWMILGSGNVDLLLASSTTGFVDALPQAAWADTTAALSGGGW